MKLSYGNKINVFLKNKEVLSLAKATNDMMGDLCELFGACSFAEDENSADIVIFINDNLKHEEEFIYEIKGNRITICGQNDLGTIYGIYSFLENELRVPPFYKIEGLKLIQINEIELEDKVINEYPQTKFRGWFVNDEDLLTNFKYHGHRDIDYEFYRNVIAPDMMDMIAETALRFKMNLIIPSTLVDITNPDEENLLNVCSERGLYLSQHHIEPLGVSKFGFAKFVKEHNLEPYFSYISNREGMVECWKHYAKLWSKYPRVIWQVGLRGGTDKPFWESEKTNYNTPAQRGALISSAINEEVSVIKSIYKGEFYATSTLWMEGAELLKSGDLKLPNDVEIVFSDIGMSQLPGNDFFEVKRDENRNYGIYYHAGYWHTGAHLAEGVLPEKMDYVYKLLAKTNTDHYSMINVANIKELVFTLFANKELVWNSNVSIDEVYDKYTRLYTLDNNKLIDTIKAYYDCLGDVGDDQYELFCKKYNFSYRKYDEKFPSVSLNDGMLRSIVYIPFGNKPNYLTKPILNAGHYLLDNMPTITCAFEEISNTLPEEYKIGFNSHWVY